MNLTRNSVMYAQKKRLTAGFTLVEMAIVLLIVGLLLGGGLMVLGAQTEAQRFKDSQRLLDEARDALLGYAVANGRLPCPASAASNGTESFCTNAGNPCGAVTLVFQAHGHCSNSYNGFLPGATLGLPGTTGGYLMDAWGGSATSRIRYAVYSTLGTSSGAINAVINPFTGSGAGLNMQTATMASIANQASTTSLLSVCSTATGVLNPGTANARCPVASTLTNQAAAVIYSLGKNAPTGGTGADEAANLNNDAAFVSHTRVEAGGTGGEFDDLVTWLPITTLFNRMVTAQRLP